jgi:acetoin utilization deacetylase AcuC-like enzyme
LRYVITSPPLAPAERAHGLLLDDALFDAHRSQGHHPERPERLVAARAAVTRSGFAWTRVEPRLPSFDDLLRTHAEEHLARLEAWRGRQGNLDADTFVAPSSVEAAQRAAGGCMAMVEALHTGPEDFGFALVRPPGHHATRDRAMGFCLLNNAAIAAHHARRLGAERVAIVDWDVHHGNGTQDVFWDDPSVLYASLHQAPLFPHTGNLGEVGGPHAEGTTVNLPLEAGADDGVYRLAFERVLLPILEDFAPDFLIVSAGYDASQRDPLAQMDVSPRGFGWMARALDRLHTKTGSGKTMYVLEGGYDLVGLEDSLLASLHGARGAEFEAAPASDPGFVIGTAARALKRHWGCLDR